MQTNRSHKKKSTFVEDSVSEKLPEKTKIALSKQTGTGFVIAFYYIYIGNLQVC